MLKEKIMPDETVSFVVNGKKMLLGEKTKGKGVGCLNGYGGRRQKRDRTIEHTATRELKEETRGITASTKDLEKIAIVCFHTTKENGEIVICRVHFYFVRKWEGEAKESKEMINPSWFYINRLPFKKMMPSDKKWLPTALFGKKLMVEIKRNKMKGKKTEEVNFKVVDSFPND